MKSTGIPELDIIVRAANKKFGKDFSGERFKSPEPLSTGSLALDKALRIGGLPRGRITEIYGVESSGKTSLALCALANAQKRRKLLGITDKRDLICDVEHSLTSPFIEGFGIDLDQTIWLRPDKAEEALQIILDFPKSGAIDFVLFDSVDAAQNERQLARQVGEVDMGGISKDMSFAVRQISKIAPVKDTTFVFINQIRGNPSGYGSPKVTPGGNALKFYATLRIELLKGIPSKDLPDALTMKAIIRKTKIGTPYHKEVLFDLSYGQGVNPYSDVIAIAKTLGMIRLGGQACFLKLDPTQEEIRISSKGGKAGAIIELQQNEELFNQIKEACFNHDETASNTISSADTDSTEDSDVS